jgi:glyoxylase-like metal-dependent hydrolase (beta-lactamase superfamily II)
MHRLGFTVWLGDDGEWLVLVDTGYAGLGGPTTGRLSAALAAVGVRWEDVDAVPITHMHADHIGGLVAEGRPAFPIIAPMLRTSPTRPVLLPRRRI